MKILSAEQLRQADAYTIKNEPVSSIVLMERAATECFNWIISKTDNTRRHIVICGTGNNGGDGLAIARMLSQRKYPVEVIILSTSDSAKTSPDFVKNLDAFLKLNGKITKIKEGDKLKLEKDIILIDAIFGTGLNRPVTGWIASCIDEINDSGNEIISIDVPSGLQCDNHSEGSIVCANHTLTIHSPKLAFMFPENEKFVGTFHILDLSLDTRFIRDADNNKTYLQLKNVKKLLFGRKKYSHKGTFGKSLLISGGKGKMGAAVLASRSCLRSGTGLLTVHVPGCGYEILQTSVPEAMVDVDTNENEITKIIGPENYDSIGIGPGIGKTDLTTKMFFDLIKEYDKPIVIDADALNILSENPDKIKKLPENSVLTPHVKEFERLAGKSKNDFDKHEMQCRFSIDNKVIVVLKGAHTCITTPEGKVYFNSTGNPGMAKGGSGDALTGMITGFLAQHYEPAKATILAVYLHGLAGDIAAKKKGVYSMIASDLIESLPKAFGKIED